MGFLEGFILLETNRTASPNKWMVGRWRFMAFWSPAGDFFMDFAGTWPHVGGYTLENERLEIQEWRWMVQMIFHCTWVILRWTMLIFRGVGDTASIGCLFCPLSCYCYGGVVWYSGHVFCCYWLLGNCRTVEITPPISWDRKYPDVATGS